MVELNIEGIPVPWAAHQGFGRRSFNPRYREKAATIWQIQSQSVGLVPFDSPVSIEVEYQLPIPKSSSNKKKQKMLSGEIKHIKKPDLDNLNKFICDCLKKHIFVDDSQIFNISSRKIYSDSPKTIIRIIPHHLDVS